MVMRSSYSHFQSNRVASIRGRAWKWLSILAWRVVLSANRRLLRRNIRYSGAKRSARRADEGANFLRILHAGSAFNAGRHVDAASTRDAQRLRHVCGIEPPGQHEWN